MLVGLFALALVGAVGWRIVAGLRAGSLPIYRTRFDRADDPLRFYALLALHLVSLILLAVIAADLLLGWELRS